jgi:hypothetical protein
MSGRRAILTFLATVLAGWLLVGSAHAQNTLPLAFGMTPQETEIALGVPLQYVSGPPRAKIYVAFRSAGVPGLYPVDEGLVLQFRRNQLTGWRQTWHLRRLGFL